jgi:hypothetical protein
MKITNNNLSYQKNSFPKIIWILWLQGWDKAPELVISCLASWARHNPDYVIHALDQKSLNNFIPNINLGLIYFTPKELEAISDQIRLELLCRYGGVWVDATAMCAKPLSSWLPEHMKKGFFAFDRPGPDRELSSWFLASQKNSYIISRWHSAVKRYWRQRTSRHSYFWLHELFFELCSEDNLFKEIWSGVKKISAQNPFHFGPNCTLLNEFPDKFYLSYFANPSIPVIKLTHKIQVDHTRDTLYSRFIKFGFGVAGEFRLQGSTLNVHSRLNFKILVGWYGSFEQHGTIGDLASVQTLVSHLVASGYYVSHATIENFEIVGSHRVDWRSASFSEFDLIIFTCGPILRTHPETSVFFEKFGNQRLVGLGVSILNQENPEFSCPFVKVFARQGAGKDFGDLAIAAPQINEGFDQENLCIGISLRGMQREYGILNCYWEKSEEIVRKVAASIARKYQLEVIDIENHLYRSGRSPEKIEDLYKKCKLIITTRFHGAVLAAKHRVPFIAIDQILGGGKLCELLGKYPWPYIYRIDNLTSENILLAADEIMDNWNQHDIGRIREDMNIDANITLASLDAYLAGI